MGSIGQCVELSFLVLNVRISLKIEVQTLKYTNLSVQPDGFDMCLHPCNPHPHRDIEHSH